MVRFHPPGCKGGAVKTGGTLPNRLKSASARLTRLFGQMPFFLPPGALAYQSRAGIIETWAAATFQPCAVRTQVCIWRPSWPGKSGRWNSVEAIAVSRP